ncbi:MAG: Ig-like domain-containing protein [Muribaculaceae bacterium]|nr:Ig-like domain-containing protein [Muribaculaceae bacterium]
MQIVKGSIVNLEEVVSINPEDATDNFLTWSSDNEDVATVDENGNVTGVGEGTANITVTVGNKTATLPVVVTDPSGVEELDVDVLYLDENEVVYNILGQQVTSKHKGIVILRDGRKVVIRRK